MLGRRRKTTIPMRYLTLLGCSLVLFSVSAFGQTTDPTADPTGFCVPGADCFDANGTGGETIGIGTTTFQMEKNGSSSSSTNPWYLIVAVPDGSGAAPTITSTCSPAPCTAPFTLGTTYSGKEYDDITGTHATDLYTFISGADSITAPGDNSMNATNMFGANEAAAFGSTPTFFDVFVYTFSPGYTGGFVPYLFNVGGSGLAPGTFLAASGGSNMGFSTPFTTAGLADGPGCTGTNGCTAGPGGGPTVPEPASVMLFGTVGLLATMVMRKRTKTA